MNGPAFVLLYVGIAVALLIVILVGFVGRGRKKKRAALPQEKPAAILAPEAPEAPARPVEAPPVRAATVEAPAPAVEAAPILETPAVEAAPILETPAVEAAPILEMPAEPIVEAPAVKRSLRERLGRARASMGERLVTAFRRSQLTAEDWEDIETILLQSDVGVVATTRIVDDLKDKAKKVDSDQLLPALRAELLAILGTQDRSLNRRADGLSVWLVTGVNGTGKTTTIGKLALKLHREGAHVVLAAADTFRAAADDQLQLWADRSGSEMVRHQPGADPAAVAFDGVKTAKERNADVLIVDTAGRLHNKQGLMDELSKIHRVIQREAGPPDEVLLVLDATTGQNGIVQARAFAEAAGVTGIALTKLDGTAKGGIVIAVQQELGLPVKLVGVGESPEDLEPFDPESFVDALIGQDSA